MARESRQIRAGLTHSRCQIKCVLDNNNNNRPSVKWSTAISYRVRVSVTWNQIGSCRQNRRTARWCINRRMEVICLVTTSFSWTEDIDTSHMCVCVCLAVYVFNHVMICLFHFDKSIFLCRPLFGYKLWWRAEKVECCLTPQMLWVTEYNGSSTCFSRKIQTCHRQHASCQPVSVTQFKKIQFELCCMCSQAICCLGTLDMKELM